MSVPRAPIFLRLPFRLDKSQNPRMDRQNETRRTPSEIERDRRNEERRRESRREHERVTIVDDGTDRRQEERRDEGS